MNNTNALPSSDVPAADARPRTYPNTSAPERALAFLHALLSHLPEGEKARERLSTGLKNGVGNNRKPRFIYDILRAIRACHNIERTSYVNLIRDACPGLGRDIDAGRVPAYPFITGPRRLGRPNVRHAVDLSRPVTPVAPANANAGTGTEQKKEWVIGLALAGDISLEQGERILRGMR